MTIIKQEVERTVRETVSVAECDQCKVHEMLGRDAQPRNNWIFVRELEDDPVDTDWSFCSWSCLYVYAHIQAGRAKGVIEPTLPNPNVGLKTGHAKTA